jgi:hypothetical protein
MKSLPHHIDMRLCDLNVKNKELSMGIFIRYVFMSASALIFACVLSGCNGRPTYNIRVLEFHSDCSGAAVVRIEHDPDPDVRSVNVEPEYLQLASQEGMTFYADDSGVHIELSSDTVCDHPLGDVIGTCFKKSDHTPLNCSSNFKKIAYRWPSHGQGSEPPFGKEGVDTPVPADRS